jgi:thiopeptide-type bacteriocin biosynthesis protein
VLAYALWSWDQLAGAPFLPRVRCGRLVLSRASWRVGAEEIAPLARLAGAARYAAARRLRERHGMPRRVVLVDADNELPVDFDNALAVDTLIELVKERERIELAELFPPPEALCAEGPEGRFVHELVIPFERRAPPQAPQSAVSGEVPRPGTVRRSFPPGSEWLYAKLYGGAAALDRALRDAVAPVVSEALAAGAADRWFYLRYADPEPHLRLRFRGEPGALLGRVLPALHAAVAPLLADGALWKLQLDTYEREVERYGGPGGIELAEGIFAADSRAALELVRRLAGDAGAEARWQVTLYGIDRLLADLLPTEDRRPVLARLRESFTREARGGKDLRRRLDERLRSERRRLAALLAGDGEAASLLTPALAVLERRSAELAPIVGELRESERRGRLTVPLREMAGSFVHLYVNRVVRSEPRAHELVLYSFLDELYASREARKGG